MVAVGFELLKKKADALKMRFQAMLRDIQKTKMSMSSEASEAFFSLTQAQYAAGDFRNKVIESVSTAEIRTQNRIDNVAGVKLPVFTEVEVSREKSDNIGLAGGGGKIQNCREKFRVLLRALIKLASLQVSGGSRLVASCKALKLCIVIKKVQANKQEHEKAGKAKLKAAADAAEALSPKSAAAVVDDDPFADVVASDRDILAQFEPAADSDVVF
ncbi:hypothetical protein BBJ28_00012771 [Nothophytophthora sp. Chile5]|nr:hypothetical protein BBJ28_00012771 [Nothophytophthora sp. Chile5]